VLDLRSGYAIRLYQWAKRWQYCGKRRISIDELRVVMGTIELTPKGKINKTLLALYKDFKKRALLPSVAEINEKTDIFVSFVENKIRGAKTVESLTFTITENANVSHGSKRHFSWSLERSGARSVNELILLIDRARELVYARAKATFLMVLLAAYIRRRRFS
jgi:plasmid replication initiation protein